MRNFPWLPGLALVLALLGLALGVIPLFKEAPAKLDLLFSIDGCEIYRGWHEREAYYVFNGTCNIKAAGIK